MDVLKSVANFFKSSDKNKTVDQYGILSPLLSTGEYISSTSEIYGLFKESVYADFMSGKVKPLNSHIAKAVDAYKTYVKNLSGHEQQLEKVQPFSTILLALESIKGNITQIEDNFQGLFGTMIQDVPETHLRSSSLVVVGYLEKTEAFATWLSNLVEHMTASDGDMIPPFRTKEMLSKAAAMSEFAQLNLHKWNYRSQGLLGEVKEMQRKGSDVALQTESGAWIDEYAHDNQFSSVEQDLIVASMRSPILWMLTKHQTMINDRVELLTSRKDWLTSKIVLEQSKLRGMDPESADYKRLDKATHHYAGLVSKLEQKIERLRA